MSEVHTPTSAYSQILDPTDEQLRLMWLEVLERHRSGAKNERLRFNAAETVLCFGLGLDAEPAPSGRTHIRKSNRDVKTIAELLRRTTGSLQSKFGNLVGDPGRQGGQATDKEVGRRFAADPELFADLYRRTLSAGRDVGLEPERLPDFLGITNGELDVLSSASKVDMGAMQEQLRAEIDDLAIVDPLQREITTELRLTSVRVGQRQFARAVLRRAGYACVFCGLGIRDLSRPVKRMLVAGHIKPWSESSSQERLDPANGIAGCPTHDAAFEGGLIWVAPGGRIVRAAELERLMSSSAGWNAAFAAVSEADPTVTAHSAAYLAWHASKVEMALRTALRRQGSRESWDAYG